MFLAAENGLQHGKTTNKAMALPLQTATYCGRVDVTDKKVALPSTVIFQETMVITPSYVSVGMDAFLCFVSQNLRVPPNFSRFT